MRYTLCAHCMFLYKDNLIQHCFVCRPTDTPEPENDGMEPRTVSVYALAVRRNNHSVRSHSQKWQDWIRIRVRHSRILRSANSREYLLVQKPMDACYEANTMPLNSVSFNQCSGSVTIWYGSGSSVIFKQQLPGTVRYGGRRSSDIGRWSWVLGTQRKWKNSC